MFLRGYSFVILSTAKNLTSHKVNLILGRARPCPRREISSDFYGAPSRRPLWFLKNCHSERSEESPTAQTDTTQKDFRQKSEVFFHCITKQIVLENKPSYFIASSTATAQATVAPTMGLLPMPIRPIISTCAGTEEEPANCASPCILPIESVRP